MNDTVIKVENLGKYYQIGSAKDRNMTFRETLVDAVKAPFLRVQEAWSRSINSPLSAPSSPVEIKCEFDEIVAFAEVEKYLDTLVKRCSSGMYVRLGAGAI